MSSSKSLESYVEDCYLECLDLYWRGLYSKVSLQVVQALEMAQEPSTEFFLYRLWIQSTAKEEDLASLDLISDHLNNLAIHNEDTSHLYYALIAIIHFELGQLEAAELMLQALKGPQSLYQCELEFLLNKARRNTNWLRSFSLEDYIVCESVAFHFISLDAYDAALDISASLNPCYAPSHLTEKIQLELVKSLGNHLDLLELSSKLQNFFPESLEYRFLHSYSLFNLDRFGEAFTNLKEDPEKKFADNATCLTLMGHSLIKEKGKSDDLGAIDSGLAYLNKAIEISKEQNIFFDMAIKLKARVLSMKDDELDLTGRFWLAELNPHSFSSLRTKPENEVDIIRRPLGASAKKGDLCFLIYNEKMNAEPNIWRLCSLYKVISDPEWDPIHRYQNELQLQFRHEIAVPLNVNVEKLNNNTILDSSDPRKYGVFEMDQTAFDIIIQNVCDTLGDEDQLSKVLNRMRSA